MRKMSAGTTRLLVGVFAAALLLEASAADDLPNEVVINGVELVKIPAGEFFKSGGVPPRGRQYVLRTDHYSEAGAIKVWLDTYYIAKYEARARDLANFLNATSGKPGSPAVSPESCSVQKDHDGKYAPIHSGEDHPATYMSWVLADRLANWMGFRLPTEAEWEKAARGKDRRRYPWGDDQPDETFAGFNTSGACPTWPVHSFEKGKSPYGIYNMAGNIREYVADWYDPDADLALSDGVKNPKSIRAFVERGAAPGDEGPWKFLKGGRWASYPVELKIDFRYYFLPDEVFRCNGTRYAVDAEVVRGHLKNENAKVLRP